MPASPLDTLLRTLELLAFESDDANAATAAIRDLFTAQSSRITDLERAAQYDADVAREAVRVAGEAKAVATRLRAERDETRLQIAQERDKYTRSFTEWMELRERFMRQIRELKGES